MFPNTPKASCVSWIFSPSAVGLPPCDWLAGLRCTLKSQLPRASVVDRGALLGRRGRLWLWMEMCGKTPVRLRHWTPRFWWLILPKVTVLSRLLVAAKAPYGIGFSSPFWGDYPCIVCENSNGLSWRKIGETFCCPLGLTHCCLKSQQAQRGEVHRVNHEGVCYDSRERHEFLNSYMHRPGGSVWSRF